MSAWIELNWLRKENKQIPLPMVVFWKYSDASGCYLCPQKTEILVGEKFYPLNTGLIIIDSEDDNKCIEATLAHEWRHHMQWYYGIKFDSQGYKHTNTNYKYNIIDYFTNSYTEMDALLYQLKKAPEDVGLEWYEWIIKI